MSKGRGTFIAFEGPDGSGKSTQARMLADKLGSRLTREPGGSSFGTEVRAILLDPKRDITPVAELFLIAADRAQHVQELVLPALDNGEDVITDRFTGASLAVQGVTRGLGIATVRQVCEIATAGLKPDLTFMIDVDPEARVARFTRRAAPDRFEQEDDRFREIEREAYLDLAASDPTWVTIDGSGPIDEVFESIHGTLRALSEFEAAS